MFIDTNVDDMGYKEDLRPSSHGVMHTWELRNALDEIYTRKGMRFLENYTAAYFIQHSWYGGVIDKMHLMMICYQI